jgi:hypothetical protein
MREGGAVIKGSSGAGASRVPLRAPAIICWEEFSPTCTLALLGAAVVPPSNSRRSKEIGLNSA